MDDILTKYLERARRKENREMAREEKIREVLDDIFADYKKEIIENVIDACDEQSIVDKLEDIISGEYDCAMRFRENFKESESERDRGWREALAWVLGLINKYGRGM